MVVNGHDVQVSVAPNARLLDVLREELDLTGTKEGCGIGECGACTVILEGKPVNACLVLAGSAQGKHIQTVEGLTGQEELHVLQKSFLKKSAVQCGFCTPGMLMSAKALLDQVPRPTEEEVKRAVSGNLCRCTGYKQIVEAILDAAQDDGKNPS